MPKPTPKPDPQTPTLRTTAQLHPTDALALTLFDPPTAPTLPHLPANIQSLLQSTLALGDFKPKPGATTVLPIPNSPTKRLLLAGLGKPQPFDLDTLRWAAAAIARQAKSLKLKHVTLALHHNLPTPPEQSAQAIAEGLILGSFVYDEFKKSDSDNKNSTTTPTQFEILEPNPALRAQLQSGADIGEIIASAANYARLLSCKPGNVINPTTLVEESRALAKRTGLKIKIIDEPEALRLGMGGLVGVGQGSLEPPALILLEHKPKKFTHTVAVVGKAVTFDTGGISIKPAADMDAMKYDKCGGMAVLGIMQAAAQLNLPIRLIGAVPTAENSVSDAAYRPGDILRMYNGKTVEITNTDAEGRLILADALAYVAEKYQPDAMIDMATLTGGVVMALGSVYAGMMANNDPLAAALETAGRQSGEWLWRLPLHDRYKPLLDGTHADLQNSGGREAHPVQGGIFLQHFVPEKSPWAHLDIAGTAHPKKEDRYLAKGASAFGVRLLIQYLRYLTNKSK